MSEESGRERVIAERYRLLSRLGEGGMGTVWRARDEVLHREVAVKEVRAPAGFGAAEVERLYARLEREAWAAARVANRNVVTVHDVAHEDGRPWIVMELVRGISLADLLDAEGPLTPPRAAAIGAEVLSALRAAHAAGVLHRDVKPSNVLLASDGRVVLTDFGIARVEGSAALTMTGEVVGSPEFLAPELALGHAPGPEADLWSLGVLLYAAVEGWSPFRQDTPLGTLRAVVDEELPPPLRAGPLAGVIQGLLRKNPAERLPAAQAERDLRLIGAGGAPRRGATSYASTVTVSVYDPPGARPPAPGPDFAPGPVAPAPPEPEPAPRNGRAVAVLVASLAVLVLAVAGLTYALVNRDNGGGGDGKTGDVATHGTDTGGGDRSGTATHRSTAESTGANSSPTHAPSSPPTTPTTPTSEGSHTPSPPAPSVSVTVTGTHTDYSGSCPPPKAQAPAFTATFLVNRVPAEVSYRWVARTGQVAQRGWETLSLPAGGERTARRRVVVTAYDLDGPVRDRIGVEVRGPVQVTSGSVPFSVTCETETPTGGASPSDE
ncbi:serine/threonine-protein kinase [Streptomyces sp. NPDC052051]|uniref:serine/threonine-protein kinase n=1 Tax=Streptomyces sp. NPDC052051 TaxID=3154649 RepID=UPI0034263EF9